LNFGRYPEDKIHADKKDDRWFDLIVTALPDEKGGDKNDDVQILLDSLG